MTKESPAREIRPNPFEHIIQIHKLRDSLLVFIFILSIYLLCGCSVGKTKIYRVGILSGVAAFADISEGIKERMTELGYIEGQNIEYDYWELDNNLEEENRILKKFVDDKVDLIFTFPTRPSVQAKAATQGTSIPVVFADAAIEGTDLVNNLKEPGGNITGVRFPLPETMAKRLELLLTLAPDAHRIYIVYALNYPNYPAAREALDKVAVDNHVLLIESPVASIEDIKTGLEALEKQADIGIEAIFLMPDLINGTIDAWEIIKTFAAKHNLPIACNVDFQLNDSGLFLVYSNHIEIGRSAADIAYKILQGTPPGSIPVATPNLYLYLNYRRAQELGLTVPEGLLKQAFKVIR
jgi:putative ABC transport system substrate-binding protein